VTRNRCVSSHRGLAVLLAAGLILCAPRPASAQPNDGAAHAQALLAQVPHQKGPCKVNLGTIAGLDVPADCAFIAESQTATFARITGNTPDPNEKGIVMNLNSGWFIVFSYLPVGYVKDDEKKDLKADEILASLRAGQEQDNKTRKQRGDAQLTITGWSKPPFFDEDTKNLTWAINLTTDRGGASINYEGRILGRKGYMSAVLVLSPEDMPTAVPAYNGIVKNNFSWKPGESYAEFREGDKVAEYGLTALIAGGTVAALAKSGFLTKFLKPIIIGVIAFFGAIGSFFKKIFGGRKAATE
jgi:uncharacterized membrane-anchored protein